MLILQVCTTTPVVSLDNSERTTLGAGFFLLVLLFLFFFLVAHIFIRHLLAKRIQKACIRADVYKLLSCSYLQGCGLSGCCHLCKCENLGNDIHVIGNVCGKAGFSHIANLGVAGLNPVTASC